MTKNDNGLVGQSKGKGSHEPKAQTNNSELIPDSLAWGMPRSIATPPLDRMLVHHMLIPEQYFTGTHLYTWVKRDKKRKSVADSSKMFWTPLFDKELNLNFCFITSCL